MCEMMDGIRSLSARLSVSSARASLTLTLRGASERMLRLAVKAVANLVDKHRLKTGKNQWSKDLSAPDVFLDVFPEHVGWYVSAEHHGVIEGFQVKLQSQSPPSI